MHQGRVTMPHSEYRLWHHWSAPFGLLLRSTSVLKLNSAKGSRTASRSTCPGQAQLSSGRKPFEACFTIRPRMSLLNVAFQRLDSRAESVSDLSSPSVCCSGMLQLYDLPEIFACQCPCVTVWPDC